MSRSGSSRSVCSRSSIKYSLFSTGYCIIDGRGRVYVVSRVTNAVTISRVSNNVHARNDLTVLCLALSVGIGNESVPIQLAQCWFPGLAISNATI